MDIKELVIRNFLTIKDAALALDNRGLLLVQGENLDDTSASSNGAGKSSIVDALCWCLYDETARGVSGDAVVNDTAKKDCMVIVTLEEGGTHYAVTRFRKHRTQKNALVVTQLDLVTGTTIDLSKGTDRETQEVVNRIMGCTLDVFKGAVYAGQEAMPDLPAMTDKQLKLLIEEAAGVEELSAAYTEARQRHLKAESLLNIVGTELKSHRQRKIALEDDLAIAKREHAEFEAGRSPRARAKLTEIKRLNTAKSDAEALIAAAGVPALTAERFALETLLVNHKAEETEKTRLVAAERAAAIKVTSAATLIKAKKKTVDEAQATLMNLHEKVGKACGECGKTYCEDDLHDAGVMQDATLDAHNQELLELVNKYKQAKTELESATSMIDSFVASMTDVSASSARLKEIDLELYGVTVQERLIALADAEIAKVVTAAKAILTEGNPWTKAVEAKEEDLHRVDLAISAAETSYALREDEVALYADAVKVFGPAGVRAHILDTVTPFLNEKTGEYLGALSDGNIHATWSTLAKTAKGDLKEKFNIEVTNDKGGKSFAAISGGEKRKVRLAAAMALQDMVASRAEKPINIFIADEIDHALDEPALERLMGVLEKKAKDKGTVVVISHNSLSDWIADVITVTKSGGTSLVTGAITHGC